MTTQRETTARAEAAARLGQIKGGTVQGAAGIVIPQLAELGFTQREAEAAFHAAMVERTTRAVRARRGLAA